MEMVESSLICIFYIFKNKLVYDLLFKKIQVYHFFVLFHFVIGNLKMIGFYI